MRDKTIRECIDTKDKYHLIQIFKNWIQKADKVPNIEVWSLRERMTRHDDM